MNEKQNILFLYFIYVDKIWLSQNRIFIKRKRFDSSDLFLHTRSLAPQDTQTHIYIFKYYFFSKWQKHSQNRNLIDGKTAESVSSLFLKKKNALDMTDKSNFDIQTTIITLYTGLNSWSSDADFLKEIKNCSRTTFNFEGSIQCKATFQKYKPVIFI